MRMEERRNENKERKGNEEQEKNKTSMKSLEEKRVTSGLL